MEKMSRQNTNRASCSVERFGKKTCKGKRRRFDKVQLPTPPPDPNIDRFEERVVSSYENSASKTLGNSIGVEDAFDHLGKLHSMMEDILEIRERNAKLFRRVRHLERVKVTRKAHLEADRLMSMGQDIVLPDEDVGFAESLLGAMLSSSFQLSSSRNNVGRSVGSNRVSRSRSNGMEHRRVSCPVTIDTRQRTSGLKSFEAMKKRPSLAIGTPKVSKWTRVKAAFKWEKATCNNNDSPNVEPEIAIRYLKIPENAGGSSEVSGPPTPAGTISSSSSIDDVFHRPQRPSSNQSTRITRRDENSDPSRRSRSLDGDASIPMNFVYSSRPRSKDNSGLQGKSTDPRIHKTPWGKVKDMMQLRRESIGRLPARSISRNEDAHSTSSLDSSDIHRSEQQVDGRPPRFRISGESNAILMTNISKSISSNVTNDFVDLASRRLTPTLTITVPSSEELRSIYSPESVTPSPPSPRQSFEKTERFSQTGYETPKEARTEQVSPASSTSGILRYGLGRSKTCQGVPFAGDYKRQQSLKGESLGSSPKMQRRDSKWNKVKRAFLTSATSVPTSPNRMSSYFFDDGDATGGSYSASASAEDLDNETATSPSVEAEIQRNYRLLHDKLGAEFYRKLAEWERLKSNNTLIRDSRSNARDRDGENMRLMGEESLTPEFKKKLEEWKRMNKGSGGETRVSNSSENRSVNRRRITDWQLWRSPSKPENKIESPRLSEDFIKKMEEWKRIKSATSRRETEVDGESKSREKRAEGEEDNDVEREEEEMEEEDEEGNGEREEADGDEERKRISGTRLSEKRRREWKSLEDEEFRSLERVLEAMEIDRQTRLSKLQRIVGSQPQRTQEVLIHTSTGLYRFEGISRKFTRKLYEWEKSQGISPELSTFRLLDPLRHGVGSLRTRTITVDVTDDEVPRRNRHRSKSVGCVDIDSWRTKRDHEKTRIRRPCSLSLNDIDNIDARSCIIASSIPTIPDEEDTSEDIAMEDSEAEPEPEAVIVDIEDVIEETASPLRKYQPHQTPVYSVASSETTSIAIPLGTVTARHEPSPVILIEPGEINPLRARASLMNEIREDSFYASANDPGSMINAALSSLSTEDQQLARSIGSLRKKRETFDVDEDNLSTIGVEKNDKSESNFTDDGKGPGRKDDTNTNWQMAPMTCVECNPATSGLRRSLSNEEDESFDDVVVTVRTNFRHSKKLLKTRRLTDTQVGYDWRKMNEPTTSFRKNDSKEEEDNRNDENSLSEANDEFADNPNVERIIINENTLNKIVVPTASSSGALSTNLKLNQDDEKSSKNADESLRKKKREAASVFVKTKRIVFSPFRRDSKNKTCECSPEIENFDKIDGSSGFDKSSDNVESDSKLSISIPISNAEESNEMEQIDVQPEVSSSSQLNRPPFAKSPCSTRKDDGILSTREKSPGMKMMIHRYNEKFETDRGAVRVSPIGMTNSATCSCSDGSSPNWKTPLLERKFCNPLDRYEEAMKTPSSLKIGNESRNDFCDSSAAILSKSSSVDFSRPRLNFEHRRERTMEPESFRIPPPIPTDPSSFRFEENPDVINASTLRAMKIRRAKENFLSSGNLECKTYDDDSNDSWIQPGSSRDDGEKEEDSGNDEESFSMAKMDIVKSASVGMINIDENTFDRLRIAPDDDEESFGGSLSQSNQRFPETRKETTSKLSRIANKFKRARLRRSKEKEHLGMSTVLKLCRQSLLVDIESNNSERRNDVGGSKNGDTKDTTRERKDDNQRRN